MTNNQRNRNRAVYAAVSLAAIVGAATATAAYLTQDIDFHYEGLTSYAIMAWNAAVGAAWTITMLLIIDQELSRERDTKAGEVKP